MVDAEAERTTEQEWVPVARELVKYGIGPWLGPKHSRWLEANTRPVPYVPQVVLIPKRLYEVYRDRPLFSRLTPEQARAIGLPE